MDSQTEEYLAEAPPAPQQSSTAQEDKDEEYWKAFEDITLPLEEEIKLPEGCPDTPLH